MQYKTNLSTENCPTPQAISASVTIIAISSSVARNSTRYNPPEIVEQNFEYSNAWKVDCCVFGNLAKFYWECLKELELMLFCKNFKRTVVNLNSDYGLSMENCFYRILGHSE
ncbi:hypothetical protein T01_8943 [Trichinella spiralis]|uniref:Uncharacterized protein n=1 Tax=Trichinella spiralis TaxID=6334 RepID=A0A0V1AST8_TRISP|nr:hypothetical protein T01_8943 [Trichinella spiralis]